MSQKAELTVISVSEGAPDQHVFYSSFTQQEVVVPAVLKHLFTDPKKQM